MRRSHDILTGYRYILFPHVESRDIVERGLSDVNDAGKPKDPCGAFIVLTINPSRHCEHSIRG